jgi:hypothetical protein
VSELTYDTSVLILKYVLFPDLKKRYDVAESACQFMKHDLESAKEDLCRMKEDLKWYVLRMRIVPTFILQTCSLEEVNLFNPGTLGLFCRQASFLHCFKVLTIICTGRFKNMR